MPAPSRTITVDELTARFATLSLLPRKRGNRDTLSHHTDSSAGKRRKLRHPSKPKRTNPLTLDRLPAELVLMIIHELWDSCDADADPFRVLHPLATTSKYLYLCFKENRFAIFRRGINNLLKESLRNTSIEMTPAFCDLVIRVGLKRTSKPWPTSVKTVEKAVDSLGMYDYINVTRRGFTIPERFKFKTPIFRDVVAWVRAQASVTKEAQYQSDKSLRRMATERRRKLADGPFMLSQAIHPYDTPFPHLRKNRSETADYLYSVQIQCSLGKHCDHAKEPWTEAEARFLQSPQYIPCCKLDPCPRKTQRPVGSTTG